MNFFKRFYLPVIIWACAIGLSYAQDPFFLQFANSESQFNPSLVGNKGATSIMLKYKSQWNATEVNGFRSGSLLFEESMPCTIFDYGLNLGIDQEGAGLLKTMNLGGKLAGTIPWEIGNSNHNLRAGLGLQWIRKSIDYGRLIFSDELDPKYGTVDVSGTDIPTSFFADNDGRSLWVFAPAVGFSHRILFNNKSRTSPTLQYGIAVHNAFSMSSGNIESILDQDTRISPRYNAFLMTEF
ncbi:MAG: type IX secretion system membrane protein PorP/SprF, partial [Saprospiraceae bacterium]